jgi:hypothetical protein
MMIHSLQRNSDVMDPKQAIQSYNSGNVDAASLLRVLVSHYEWCIPGRREGDEVAPLIAVADDERWLQIFSDKETYQDYLRHIGDPPDSEYILMPGPAVFASLGNNITGLNINPDSEASVHYASHQFENLRQWGLAIEVERILAGESTYTKPFHLLRAFDGYRLVFSADENNAHRLALVPDLNGRPLAAVFTADDAVRAFIEDAKKVLGEQPLISQIDGVSLFTQLKQLPIGGLVFNCSGPGPAHAVDIEFAEVVLTQDLEN